MGFFNVGLNDSIKMSRNKFDDSFYDTIVFDEIFQLGEHMLHRIKHYVQNHSDKICLAIGDTCQNDPIELLTNTQDQSEYAMECVSQIFPNNIKLLENKRLKTQEDKDKLKNLKKELDDKEHILNS